MSGLSGTDMVRSGVEQLLSEVNEQLEQLGDVDKQLEGIHVIVNNFVSQTFQVVSDNDDTQGVNETLINSLAQIRNFIQSRPNDINITRMKLEQRKTAYEQCLILANEVKNTVQEVDQPSEEATQSQRIIDEEQTREVVDDEKKRRIIEGMDETGQYVTRRKIGGRPEKLKDIRKVESELKSQNYREEDI